MRTEDRIHILGTNCYSVVAIDETGKGYFMEGYDDSDGMSVRECRDAALRRLDVADARRSVESTVAVAVTGSTDWGEDHEVASCGDLEAVVRWRRARSVQSSE